MTQAVRDQEKVRTSSRRILPALGLFLLAPLVGEFLLGNVPITMLGALLLLAPLYGGGALLIRETARRWRLGWPGIGVLCLVYGLVEEAFVTQSLFNPNYVGLRLLDYGFIPGLGISAWWTVFVLSIHAVWSTAVPIALVESLTPDARTTPWLGPLGIAVTALLFVASCVLLFFFQQQEPFMASVPQFIGSAGVVALFSGVAIALRGRDPRPQPSTTAAPVPRVVGGATFLLGSAFMALAIIHDAIPAILNVAGMLALLAAGWGLLWRWSARAGWSQRHVFAAAGGLLLVYAWYSFVQVPSIPGSTPLADAIGNAVFACGALALLVFGWRRLGAER